MKPVNAKCKIWIREQTKIHLIHFPTSPLVYWKIWTDEYYLSIVVFEKDNVLYTVIFAKPKFTASR